VDLFMKLFGEDTIKLITIETNTIHQSLSGRTPPILESEIRQFLGICMYMSVVSMPNKRMYWQKDHRIAFIADAMYRDRFFEILRCLHFSDNELQPKPEDPAYDKLYKVRAVIDLVSSHFMEFVEFEKHLSVDEQMVPFKGNHALKNYMKAKPVKWGYKIFALAGSSGYIYRFQIAGDNTLQHDFVEPEIGKSGQVVLELIEDVPPGTQLYFDNWFCSPLLIKKLKEKQLGATGTVRQNRKAGCSLLTERELRREGRGSYDYKSADGVVLCDWYDNKVVTVASNCHSVLPVKVKRRWSKTDKEYVDVPCPNLVDAYNKKMGGVDKNDMLMALYRMHLKGRKWYKRLFFHFVDLSIINAWTIMRQTSSPKISLVSFKLEIAMALIKGEQLHHPMAAPASIGSRIKTRASGGGDADEGAEADDDEDEDDEGVVVVRRGGVEEDPRTSLFVCNSVRYDRIDHLPQKVAKLPKRCKMEECKRRSKWYCIKCKVYLCVDEKTDCFLKFHKK
jgi:Transposase IS4